MQTTLPTKSKTVREIQHLEAGRRIRALREKAGMSVRRLAKEMNFTAPYLSDLELGRRNWDESKYKRALEILAAI